MIKLLYYLLLLTIALLFSCSKPKEKYVCKPCNLPCDEKVFSKGGFCPDCNMELVKKSDITPKKEFVLNEIDIKNGSGTFLIESSKSREKSIKIHYYKPEKFNTTTQVIIVLAGAGRNGNDYRDAWIEASEIYNLVVLAPEYDEKQYPRFWNYNLAGMIYDVNIKNETYKISTNPKEWIFNDFDRIFTQVKNKLNLKADSYDMFGHSAGGQILHRLALFQPKSKVDKIVAANSGWYTIPTSKEKFPYGISKSVLTSKDLDFTAKLTVLLGELDNENETKGHLRHSPEIDKQGLHRLARGTYFYNTSKNIADSINIHFNWKIVVVPNVGHNYKAMSRAAANYLYNHKK